eukprot:TRINITY_DN5050_c0_g1_i1.p1 TRINITY_DN5050_c0_g1~~TRINITY_DN5050_c0_g1_i1.p1  ORF type:complete len:561 (-),score=105.15 TRINITY_DN5050_c0_g1_i1:16-1698(-)
MSNDFSMFYAVIINYFNSISGFDKLLEIISRPNVTLSEMFWCIRPLFFVRFYVDSNWLRPLAMKFQEFSFGLLLNKWAGKKMAIEQRSQYNEILENIQEILKEVITEEQINQLVQTFHLQFATRELKGEGVVSRVEGLKTFKSVIEKTVKQEPQTNSGGARYTAFLPVTKASDKDKDKEKTKKEEKPVYVDPKFVLSYIQDNKIIERLISIIHSHEQIPRQGLPLLSFLAEHGQLKIEHIDLLWEGSLGIHESHKRNIYFALSNLANTVSLEFVDHLLNRMVQTPPSYYDQHLLDLVLTITDIALKSKESTNRYVGLSVFWQFIFNKDGVPIDSSISDAALNYFSKLLGSPRCAEERDKYFQKCFKTFYYPQNFALIINYLETIQGKREKANAIQDLERKYNMLATFFDGLKLYKLEAMKEIQCKEDSPAFDINKIAINGKRYDHIEHIEHRLSFLHYIFSRSTLMLDTQRIDILWTTILDNPLSQKDVELMLNWLEAGLNFSPTPNTYPLCVDNISQHIFDKMLDFDCSNLTTSGFSVFRQLFLQNNEKINKIKKIEGK